MLKNHEKVYLSICKPALLLLTNKAVFSLDIEIKNALQQKCGLIHWV